MGERERQLAIVRAKGALAQAMFELRKLKDHSTPSGWKQAAEVLVAIGKLRDCLDHLET